MALINRLIMEAKAKPEVVYINTNQVGTVAAHMRASMHLHDLPIDWYERQLKGGQVYICGIQIKVRGLDGQNNQHR